MAITKVTNSLVATNAIQGTLIADNAITSVHIAQNQVTAVQIPDGSITSTQIAANSIDTAELVTGSIDTIHIGNDQVTTAKIADLNVTTGKIANNAITAAKIPDGSITETQLSSSAAPTFGTITTTGALRGPASFTIDPAAVGDNTGTVVIAGSLQVDGTTTTVNSTTLSVADLNITVASGAGNASAANNAGLTIAGAGATMLYQSSGDEFRFNKPLYNTNSYKTGTTSTFVGQLTNSGGKLRLQSDADRDIQIGDTNNADIIYVDTSAQKVGIGTSSPDSALTVNTSTTGDGIELQSSEVSIAKLTRHVVDSTVVASLDGVSGRPIHIGGAVNEKVILANAGGNVGIGETSPSAKLHVKKTAVSTQHYDLYATAIIEDNEGRLQIIANDGGSNAAALLLSNEEKHWGVVNHGPSQNNTFGIGYYASSSTGGDFADSLSSPFTITTGGNVGIGDSSPQDYLEINGSGRGLGGLTISNSSHNHAALSFARSSTATARIFTTEPAATHTSQFNFQTSDASGGGANLVTAMVINENQNVGIGNTSPSATLEVGTLTSGQTGTMKINNEGGNTATLEVLSRTNRSILKVADNDTAGYISAEDDIFSIGRNTGDDENNININSSNLIGIGTNNPSTRLHMKGTGDMIRLESTNSGAGGAQIDMLHFSSSPADGDTQAAINMGGYWSGTSSAYFGAIRCIGTNVGAKEGKLAFYTRDDGDFLQRFGITHTGVLETMMGPGQDNVALGNAAFSNASFNGDNSTALGQNAGGAHTTGIRCTFVGNDAGAANTSANDNTAVGQAALATCQTSGNNTAVGRAALNGATSANNTGIGFKALVSLGTGGQNTAVGSECLDALDTGSNNTAVGYEAAGKMTGGYDNVSMGRACMLDNTNGHSNVAIGVEAMENNQTGNENVAIGKHAGRNVTGGGSVIVGNNAGNTLTSGNSCILIGREANVSGSGNSELVIGNSVAGQGNNTGKIYPPGGGAIYQATNGTSFAQTSDERIKKNIVNNNEGLNKLKDIQVRNFEYRTEEEVTELPSHLAVKQEGIQLGVIAQEIEKVLPEVIKIESSGVKTVNTDNLTWYLINAVKELSAEIEELKKG